ncbi:hypothetical protein NKH74_12165 [Mesorhizobium sp. M0933]|uniref:hypothetical protein n=1 Tax=Mesorhizobium sp. M0933 TaxID=2957030 RepID=UPI00333B659F
MTPTYRGVDGPDGSTRAKSVSAGEIDPRQTRSGLDHAPLRSPYPAAQRDFDADTAVFVQHFIRTFKGELRSVEPLSGSRQFHIQKFHYPASIAVPSIGKPLVAAVGSGCSRACSPASIWWHRPGTQLVAPVAGRARRMRSASAQNRRAASADLDVRKKCIDVNTALAVFSNDYQVSGRASSSSSIPAIAPSAISNLLDPMARRQTQRLRSRRPRVQLVRREHSAERVVVRSIRGLRGRGAIQE